MSLDFRIGIRRIAVLLVLALPAAFTWSQSTCSRMAVVPLDSGIYNFQMNEFNSTLAECASVNGVGFKITTANFNTATNGAPATYTSLYRGCHWGSCTSSNPFPIQESNLASATTSVTLTQPSGFANDAAYDIWFNQTSTTSGQPNGTEIMIWLNHQGSIQPFGTNTGSVRINGAQYEIWTGKQSSWLIVSYVATNPVTAVTNMNLLPFFADSVARGSLEPSWWLIDVEFGFEIWKGGLGLAASSFSVSAAADAGGSAPCDQAPPAPSGLRGTAASSTVINLSWNADTAPTNCAITGYDLYRGTTSGFTPSTANRIASGVTGTSYSDTGRAASTTYYYKIVANDAAGASASSAQAAATTSAASAAGTACHVTYSIVNHWPGGFQAAVTLNNSGTSAWSGWTLTWTFANGQTITSAWNGTVAQSGASIKVSGLAYNGSIPAKGSYNGFGFNATWNNTTNAIPAAFAVNGTTCK